MPDEATRKTDAAPQAGGSGFAHFVPPRVRRFLSRDVWAVDLGGVPTFRALAYRGARVLYLAVRGLLRNNCLNQASAMTYVTVLSLVPLLALGFSVAKGFGYYERLVQNTIQPALDSAFGELPAAAAGATAGGVSSAREGIEMLLSFVDRTNFSNLGILGLAFVLLAALKLLTSMENAFNRIWGIGRSRSFVRRSADYIALVVVTPVLLVLATAATSSVQSNRLFDYLSREWDLGPVLTLGFSLVVLWLGFGFLYVIMPNTRVNVTAGLVGGIVGGTLWQLFQMLHVEFQVGIANYNAIYAGFAAIPIFLVWVYAGWIAVLLGAQFAWAHQSEPEYRELLREPPDHAADREWLAARSMVTVARAFREGAGAVTATTLAARLGVPPATIAEVLAPLVDRGLLVAADKDAGGGYVPGAALDRIRIQAVLDVVRGRSDGAAAADDRVAAVLEGLRREAAASARNLTLEELAGERPGPDPGPSPDPDP